MDHTVDSTDRNFNWFHHSDGSDGPSGPVDGGRNVRASGRPDLGCVMAGDHELLDELNQLGKDLGPFAGGILTRTLSVTEQLDFGYRLIRLARRIRARAEQQPFAIGPHSFDGDAL